MKTISKIIREIFATGNPIKTTKQNSKAYETKTDESIGVSILDNPDAREDPGTDTRLTQSPKPGTDSGREPARDPEKEFQEALSKAFEEGVIAGRNAKIEETLSHCSDDGIPRFNGGGGKKAPTNDIFSLAREA